MTLGIALMIIEIQQLPVAAACRFYFKKGRFPLNMLASTCTCTCSFTISLQL